MKGIHGGRGPGDPLVKSIIYQERINAPEHTVSVREEPAGVSLGNGFTCSQDDRQSSVLERISSSPKFLLFGLDSQSISVVPEAAGPQQFHLCQVDTGVSQ